MSQAHFTMRAGFRHLLRRLLIALIWGPFAIWMTTGVTPEMPGFIAEGNYSSLILGGLHILMMYGGTIFFILQAISSIVFKCEVQNDQVEYRSLFRRREFSYSEIERLELLSGRIMYVKVIEWRIYLRDEKRWLEVPFKATNINLFLEYMISKNIPITDYDVRMKGK